jgi:predicted outer membrane repeat protein
MGTLTLTDSTVSSNISAVHGGGIFAEGSINIYSSTIAFNEAGASSNGAGGGIYVGSGTTNIRNTVLAGNRLSDTATYNDCSGVLGIYGNNKFWNSTGGTAAPASTGSSSYLEALSELGPLQNNGGPTRTHAIVAPRGTIDGGAPSAAASTATASR